MGDGAPAPPPYGRISGHLLPSLVFDEDIRDLGVAEGVAEASPRVDRAARSVPSCEAAPEAERTRMMTGSDGGVEAGRLVPRQLPADVRGFVNRFMDLGELDAVLPDPGDDAAGDVSVCVVAGTAGVGKTSFAVHWAHRVRSRFPDGQLYINLRGYGLEDPVTATRALGRFLVALGVPEAAVPRDPEARAELYRSLLADKRILVLLDNVAKVEQVRPLLPAADGCITVITSRSRLSGLVAIDGAYRLTLEVFPEDEAIRLLQVITERYRANDTREEVAELARLCARLPLALRIAAERMASRPKMPLGDLIRDLRDESELWDALSTDDNDEADAVRTVFAWSYRALTAEAARLFRLLGLHPGPDFGVAAAAALVGDTPSRTRRQLDVLVGAHLVEQVGQDRFRFHDLLRAYALDQAQAEETAASRADLVRTLLEWYARSADRASTALGQSLRYLPAVDEQPSPADALVPDFADREAAQQWLEAEWANLRAAATSATVLGEDRLAWRLPLAFRGYYQMHNAFDGRLELGRNGVAAARRAGELRGEAENLFELAVCEFQLDHLHEALDLHRAARDLYYRLGDAEGEALTLNAMGFVFFKQREFADAAEHHRRAEGVFRSIGNEAWGVSAARNAIEADLRSGTVPTDDARELLARGLELQRAAGHIPDQVDTLVVIARLERASGDLDAALVVARSAVEIGYDASSSMLEAYALLELGDVELETDRASDALATFQRSASAHREVGARGREAQAHDGMGRALTGLGRHEEAVAFHRRAATVFAELGFTWQRAAALTNLALALEHTGQVVEAADRRSEALALLDGFTDPATTSLRTLLADGQAE